MKLTKYILNIAVKIVTWLLVAFTVFMMIFTVFTVTTVDKNDRDIFGAKFYIVQTDSMSKSDKNADMDVHFNAGDIIIIKNVKDPRSLQAGDIIGADKSAQNAERAAKQYSIEMTGDNREAAQNAAILFLSVKPQFIDGVIEEIGPPEQLFASPRSEKTRAFLRSAQETF